MRGGKRESCYCRNLREGSDLHFYTLLAFLSSFTPPPLNPSEKQNRKVRNINSETPYNSAEVKGHRRIHKDLPLINSGILGMLLPLRIWTNLERNFEILMEIFNGNIHPRCGNCEKDNINTKNY